MVWTKGVSGNPGGRAKEKPFRDALRLELAAAGDDHKALRRGSGRRYSKRLRLAIPLQSHFWRIGSTVRCRRR